MMSSTHSLLAMALLSKRGDRKRNWVVFAGSVLPDAAIYFWAPYQQWVNGVSGEEMWRELYFADPMQSLIAYFNSIPIYAALAALGYVMRAKTWGKLILFFALAALVHIATDLPVHNHDAYRHFWPFSDWRFISPFSYYEQDHHAGWVSLLESALALISIAVLWRRFPKLWIKFVLGVFALVYFALPIIMRLSILTIDS